MQPRDAARGFPSLGFGDLRVDAGACFGDQAQVREWAVLAARLAEQQAAAGMKAEESITSAIRDALGELRYETGASRRDARIDVGAVAVVAERLRGRGKQSI